MEEKERYEIHIYDDICVDLYDNGVLDKSINDTYKLEELLNQQSKRIKELEQENLSLQEQSIRDNQNWIEETTKLKQQLHDLPKKIVEDFYDEIRHRAILEDDYCPDHNLERKYGVRKCLLENIRTTILKKFGGKNE